LPILIDAAKNDPSHAVRGAAIDALATIPTAPSVAALEDLLRTTTDVTLTRFAAGALARNRHANAAVAARALIQRKDAPTDVRIVAIRDLSTPARLSPTPASAVVGSSSSRTLSNYDRNAAAARQERLALTTDQRQYLMALLFDADEVPDVRGAAFDRLDELAVNEIIRLSKTTTATPLVRRIVDELGGRSRSDVAIDGLIEIMLNTNVALDVRRRSMERLARYRSEAKVKKAIDQFVLATKRGS
jgi:HEAT repeat protein